MGAGKVSRMERVPCLQFEDDHLLVVNKPAGLNTHSPAVMAGEGIYEWLKHRETRWAGLAIIHRLDKETSGLMVFGKTVEANRSLTAQFTARTVSKSYLMRTDRTVEFDRRTVKSSLVRSGERYLSRPVHPGGDLAETVFERARKEEGPGVLVARPLTGRTHQIRVHAAAEGFPILGDTLYGGSPAGRVYLHARELAFKHPITGAELHFECPAPFGPDDDARVQLRELLIDPEYNTAFRLIHGAADGYPGLQVDRWGDELLAQSAGELTPTQSELLRRLARHYRSRGVYHKVLRRGLSEGRVSQLAPRLIDGEGGAEERVVRENGLEYGIRFDEGYSVGLFLDQRDNRRRLLRGQVGSGFDLEAAEGKEVLNAFSYTCGFSVCAARRGAKVTSLDLSRKYLDWGRANFERNGLAPAGHDFIYGDVFDWMKRLVRKGRLFDLVLFDPPTFSRSKESGVFRASKDYGRLAGLGLGLLRPGGVMFCSCNDAGLGAEEFLGMVEAAVAGHSPERRILQRLFCPQPPDFPISRSEPAYLKTVWLRIE